MAHSSNADKASLSSVVKDTEKAFHVEGQHINQYANLGLTQEECDFYEEFKDTPKHKKLLRKIDWRLLPLLMLLYLAAYLDRANIGKLHWSPLNTLETDERALRQREDRRNGRRSELNRISVQHRVRMTPACHSRHELTLTLLTALASSSSPTSSAKFHRTSC